MATVVPPEGAQAEHDAHSQEAPAKDAAALHTRGMPGRYALVAVGSGLVMLGIPLSVPMGPAASTAGRELACLVASTAGLALLLVAGLRSRTVNVWCARWRWLRRVGLTSAVVLALGTLVVFAGAGDLVLRSHVSRMYVTDIVSLTATDAEQALAGHNPYTGDAAFREALARYPYALATPLRGRTFGTSNDHPAPKGIAAIQQRYAADPDAVRDAFDPRTLHSYPALSFLLYVPLLWAGASNILLLHVFVYWALFAWLLWIAPVGWRGWGALAALAGMSTVAASLIESNEVICIALLLTAWHLRHRGQLHLLTAVLVGLACAYKQYVWFFAPFFVLEYLQRDGWRQTLRWSLLALAAFLVPNVPYIVASPYAWFDSLWLPMREPLFATGIGIISLSVGHLLPYAPPALYALLEVTAVVAALLVYARYQAQIGEAVLVLALVPLYFAFRSLDDYFAFAPWLALYAVHAVYGEQPAQPRSRLGALTAVDMLPAPWRAKPPILGWMVNATCKGIAKLVDVSSGYVTYPRLKPGACPHPQGAGRAAALGDLMGRMCRSAGVTQPASERSRRLHSAAEAALRRNAT
jgi:hypothetical protein